ncbi:MAG: ABC transporter permease [Alphaproteobacteria bacterium]
MKALSSLDMKLLRDMWRRRGQVLAIAMVVASAVATLIMALAALHSLSSARASYYEGHRFADAFVSLKRAPDNIAARLRAVPGVVRAEVRVTTYATLDIPGMPDPVRGLAISMPADNASALNALVLRTGRLPDPARPDEIIVHESFANAHGFSPGSTFAANINGRRLSLTVVGIALSPEFIYVIAPGEIVPDDARYGVFWMDRKALAAATDMKGAFNNVLFRLSTGVNERETLAAIDARVEAYGGTGAYGRSQQMSHSFLDSEFGQLSTMAGVIPQIFLLVASFLVYSVIARQIETQREEIGILKAFGYSDAAVAWHFIKMALVTAMIGLLAGWASGYWLAGLITDLYRQYFRFPSLELAMSLDVLALSALVALAAAGAGALVAVVRVTQLSPAGAMAPPVPAVYGEGPLERLGLLKGMGSTGFMIIRHITRFPLRSTMTVTGIALSLGLLISTTQFFDSVRVMVDTFFFRAQRQDVSITFTELRADAVRADLARLPGVISVELRRGMTARLTNATRSERIYIQGIDRDARLSQQVDVDGRTIVLPTEGLVLSRRLADKLAVSAGDMLDLRQLDGRRRVARMPVAFVIDEYVGLAAYMDRRALNRLAGDGPVAASAALKIDPLRERELFHAVRDIPGIFTISLQRHAYTRFRELVDQNIMTMVWFYCGFAAIIAFGVAYNASRITLSERSHELATLRVLGYHRAEVARILVGELALLTILGLPLGVLAGYGLSLYMIDRFTTDLFQMPFGLTAATVGQAMLVVGGAALVSCLLVARNVANLDLVRVLKTRY